MATAAETAINDHSGVSGMLIQEIQGLFWLVIDNRIVSGPFINPMQAAAERGRRERSQS